MERLALTRRLSSLRRASFSSSSSPPFRSAWVCPTCSRRDGSGRRRFQSSSSAADKPYYVTTPIFYVNAAPHIGHMYSMILADVLKRWQTLKGKKALFCTGTDEHGMKIQRAAARQDVQPKEFCDTNSATFKQLAERSQLDHDFFIRTTDPDHVEAVEHFWFLLRERGLIYESTHKGWYCVSDECFYPESMIERAMDPMTGKTFMASVETGNEVEWTEEKNYHFRMTALRDKLLAFFKENPQWVVPAQRMKEVEHWVANNLEDLSISRPVNRLEWGIRVPDDPSQTVYVWVDALINYITKAGFPNWAPGAEHAGGWPADVHVIGKDILRFHAVYWPALLLALDLPLPKRILSHAHWTMGGKKMSKSLGNVVNPFFAIDRWGVDAMRYFFVHDGGIAHDSDYANVYIVDKYKKGLQGGLGNLLGRVTRPKIWSVRRAVEASSAGEAKFAEAEDDTLGVQVAQRIAAHRALLEQVAVVADAEMRDLDASGALRRIMEVVYATNAYLHDLAPWHMVKSGEKTEKIDAVIYHAAESLRIVGILLQPFIPGKACELLDILGVAPERRTFADARVGADEGYGVPMRNPGKSALESLFPPLDVED